MGYRDDYYTNTEADAGAFERAFGEDWDDDPRGGFDPMLDDDDRALDREMDTDEIDWDFVPEYDTPQIVPIRESYIAPQYVPDFLPDSEQEDIPF